MKSSTSLLFLLGVIGSSSALAQAAAPRQGPGIQAGQDPRYAAVVAQCKNHKPPAPPAGGPPAMPPAVGNTVAREYTIAEIPGVIAAGARWNRLLQIQGNNADGIVGTDDGGLLIAQNENSAVIKLDKDGKTSVVYSDTNTGGALSINTKGVTFIASRMLNPAVVQLAPTRKVLANSIDGDTLDCLGGVMNDVTADSKGGVYFTLGGLFYANPQGVVKRYGDNLRTNGLILSPDEKRVYVTNQTMLVAFDVQPDGSLSNQRDFSPLEGGGGDGMTVDAAGRIYVTSPAGIHVIAADGKKLGLIQTPRPVVAAAFGGADKKTLYVVETIRLENGRNAEIISVPMVAQGFEGRPK